MTKIFLCCLSLLLNTNDLFATSFYPKPFEETIQTAPIILKGKVLKNTVEEVTFTDGSKHLFTITDFGIKETLKGVLQVGSKIRFRELGGEKDGVSLSVSGRAEFMEGEEVVVLLDEYSEGSYPLKGMMMAKLNLKKTPQGEEELSGPAINLDEHPGVRPSKELTKNKWTLASLKELIKKQETDPKTQVSQTKQPEEAQNSGELRLLKPSDSSSMQSSQSANSVKADLDTLKKSEGFLGFGIKFWLILAGILGFGILRMMK